MELMESTEVKKSGIVWAEVNFSRAKRGLEIHVKVDERIEDFFKSFSHNGDSDPVEMYGREWLGEDLKIYRMDRDFNEVVNYTIIRPAEGLENNKEGRLNLSFLRLVGISRPEGVKFVINGPFSKEYVSRLSKIISTEVRNLIKEFVVPIGCLNFRISSQDF